MWSRKRFDIGWLDLADGLLGLSDLLGLASRAQARVEELWSSRRRRLGVPLRSIRLGPVAHGGRLPAGERGAVSAVTIPDMARIVEHHGLIAVPLDIEPETMLPQPEEIAAAVTPRTKAVLDCPFVRHIGAAG